jgi:hypothetical protein
VAACIQSAALAKNQKPLGTGALRDLLRGANNGADYKGLPGRKVPDLAELIAKLP